MKNIFILLFLAFSYSGFSQNTTTTTGDGLWNLNSNSHWNNGVPSCTNNNITISATDTIYLGQDNNYESCPNPFTIHIYGTLRFFGLTTGKKGKLFLPAGSVIYVHSSGVIQAPNNGGGNSALIKINDTTVWTAGDGTIDSPGYLDSKHPYDPNTFPVDMLSFESSLVENSVVLNWATASEINSDYFQIEHSIDGKEWKSLGRVSAAGNSNVIIDYSFIDKTPQTGVNYYRLLQVDFDGKYEYFGPLYQSFDQSNMKLSIYPNPNSGENLNFEFEQVEGNTQILIFDFTGKMVYKQEFYLASNSIRIPLDLAKGIYNVQIINKQNVVSKNLIIN